MYIAMVPNRNSPPAILLRESFRDGEHVRTRTLANLSDWSAERIESLRAVLKGSAGPFSSEPAFEIVRSRPHGHVTAVLGTMRRLKLRDLLGRKRSADRDLSEALIAARIVDPQSKLATVRGLSEDTLTSTLAESLGIDSVDENKVYRAMDWLLEQQDRIEKGLAKRHLSNGTLALYDLSSSYFEGRTCPLAKLGHSRDEKKGTLQIVFGLLCNAEGCPVAVQVFEGNTGDPTTFTAQVKGLRERFGLENIVWVGDRGMITSARIREDLEPIDGFDWITTLRSPAIQKLVASGTLQLSLFDKKDLAEISDPSFPDERLIVCRNPLLAEERARKREALLVCTERELEKVAAATRRTRNGLSGKDKIALRVGKVLGRYKVGKHFQLTITETSFTYRRDANAISTEAALDGIYVIRTSVPKSRLSAKEAVRSYKQLSSVERAFRSLKTVDLKVRPIHHRLADRVRAHVFLCMLAYYVEWHMRRDLAPLLFDDEDKEAAENRRKSIVAPSERSEGAEAKARKKRTEDGEPVHSFQTLLRDLGTITKNRVQPKDGQPAFDLVTRPTKLQSRALAALRVSM